MNLPNSLPFSTVCSNDCLPQAEVCSPLLGHPSHEDLSSILHDNLLGSRDVDANRFVFQATQEASPTLSYLDLASFEEFWRLDPHDNLLGSRDVDANRFVFQATQLDLASFDPAFDVASNPDHYRALVKQEGAMQQAPHQYQPLVQEEVVLKPAKKKTCQTGVLKETRKLSRKHEKMATEPMRLACYLVKYRGWTRGEAALLTDQNPQEPRSIGRYTAAEVDSRGVRYAPKFGDLNLQRGHLPIVAVHFGLELEPNEEWEQGHDMEDNCPAPNKNPGENFHGAYGQFKCMEWKDCGCKGHKGKYAVYKRKGPAIRKAKKPRAKTPTVKAKKPRVEKPTVKRTRKRR